MKIEVVNFVDLVFDCLGLPSDYYTACETIQQLQKKADENDYDIDEENRPVPHICIPVGKNKEAVSTFRVINSDVKGCVSFEYTGTAS